MPARKKDAPPTKKQKGSQQENAKGTSQFYGDGTWNTFSVAAIAWFETALASNSAEETLEDRDSKKKTAERRIRLVVPGDDKPCDIDAEQLAWVACLSFYVINAPFVERLKNL